MIKKNLQKNQVEFSLFKERFFVFNNELPDKIEFNERPDAKPALRLISKVNAVEEFRGGGSPKLVLERNPYAENLISFAEKFNSDDFEFNEIDHTKQGVLILKYRDGPEMRIEGNEYIAIFWLEIQEKIKQIFHAAGILASDKLIRLAVKKHQRISMMALLIAEGETVPHNLIAEVKDEIDATRPFLDKASKRKQVKLRTEVGTGAVKSSIEPWQKMKIPGKPAAKVSENFSENLGVLRKDFNGAGMTRLRATVRREDKKINAEIWDPTNDKGVKQIMAAWKKLGINLSDPSYRALFYYLGEGVKRARTHPSGNSDMAKMYRNPFSNLSEISKDNDPQGFGENYVQALTFFKEIQGTVNAQNNDQLANLEMQKELDSPTLAKKLTDGVRSNLAKFQTAIKKRDYATAAMYMFGVWAIYKSYKHLSVGEGNTPRPIGKWLAYLGAGYVGHHFLKNAGYDMLKIAGFKDEDYEIDGTGLEVIRDLNLPEAKDLDYNILGRVSEMKVADLDELYGKANNDGVNFIHPHKLRNIFPNLADAYSFDMGIGEKGLGDTTGASLTSLSPREREYVRVGQQLYKVMAVLRAAYLKTFYKESNLTWEDAMKKYPELRHTKIRHLVHSMKEWAPDSGKLKMAPEKTMNRLKEGFNKLHPDFPIDINDVAGKAGHFQADVMNFPVVFVYNPQKKGFDTYLINNYGGAETPGGNYIQGGTIPLKGGSPEVAAGIIEKAVKARMAKLLKPVRSGPKLKGIDYDFDDGQWRTEIKMRKMPNLGVDAEDGEAIITPYKDGKGVIIKIVNGGTILRLDEAAAAERPTEFSLITNLTRDKRFKAFIPFYNAKPKKLSTKNVDEAKGWFTLMIGDNKFELDMMFHDGKYVPRDLDDAGESAQEKALLKNSAFSREYVEALQSDPMFELNDTIGKLNDVIQYAVDETSIKHFLTSIAGNVNKGTLAGWNSNLISGSVSKNFTRMVLNCTMYESLARLRTHVKGATSLADVEQFRINDLAKVNAKLKAMIRILSVENYKVLGGEEPIDHEEFLSRVVDQVRAASSISGEYAEARENLEHVIYNGMDLPGIFEVSDWNEASHKAVGKMIDVFSYHTAHLDNHKIPDTRPGKDDGDEFYINLDDLDFPATATPDFKGNSWDDPAMRGHYILQYLKYVREQIGTNAAVATKDSISSGRFPSVNSKKWGIAKFEHWAETEGSYEALNPLDDEDPYTHDMEQHKEGKHTKLDLAIIAAYDKTAEFLNKRYDMKQTWEKDKFKAKSNWNGKAMNISKFKALKPAEQKAQGYKKKDIDRWGLYSIGMGGTKAAPEWKSKLWEISKRIQAGSTTASGKVRKSKQVYLIQMEVDTYMRTIFRMSEDAEDYPFRVKPGLWDKHVVTPWRKWRNGIT